MYVANMMEMRHVNIYIYFVGDNSSTLSGYEIYCNKSTEHKFELC